MACHPTRWLPQSFMRSPQWRMLRASHRVQEGVAFDPRIDDEWVDVAMHLVVPDREGVSPEVRAAFELWIADEHPRWFLEASLLTTQSFDEVAAACRLSEPVVSAFHELFFHVKHRLSAHDWVLILAVRSNPMNDFAGPQPAGLWKYMAFKGGPLVLDIVVAVTLNRPLPSWLRKTFLKNPILEEKRCRLKMKIAIAALTANSASQLGSLVELCEELDELEAKMGLDHDDAASLTPAAGELIAMLNRQAHAEGLRVDREKVTAKPKPHRPRPAHSVWPTSKTGGSHRE